MCSCKAHQSAKALCTCECPDHGDHRKMPVHEHDWVDVTEMHDSTLVERCAHPLCDAERLLPRG